MEYSDLDCYLADCLYVIVPSLFVAFLGVRAIVYGMIYKQTSLNIFVSFFVGLCFGLLLVESTMFAFIQFRKNKTSEKRTANLALHANSEEHPYLLEIVTVRTNDLDTTPQNSRGMYIVPTRYSLDTPKDHSLGTAKDQAT